MAIIENIMKEIMKQQFVNEETVARDSRSSAQIAVSLDISRSYGGNIAYFKYKPNADIDWKHCARISFKAPEYVDHYGKSYRLSRDEKKRLINMLKSESSNNKGISGWEAAIKNFNELVKDNNNGKYILPEDLPMPNYMELK